jgi:hypothetical protein
MSDPTTPPTEPDPASPEGPDPTEAPGPASPPVNPSDRNSDDDAKVDESGLPVSEDAPHLEPEIAANAKGLP